MAQHRTRVNFYLLAHKRANYSKIEKNLACKRRTSAWFSSFLKTKYLDLELNS